MRNSEINSLSFGSPKLRWEARLTCSKLCLDQGQTWESTQAVRANCTPGGPGFFYSVSKNWPAGSGLENLASLELGWRNCFLLYLLPRHQGIEEETCSWGEVPGIQVILCISGGHRKRGLSQGMFSSHKKEEDSSQSALTIWLDLESPRSHTSLHFCEAFPKMSNSEGRAILDVGSTIQWTEVPGLNKGNENKKHAELQAASLPGPLLPDCTLNVTSCLVLLPSCLLCQDGLHLLKPLCCSSGYLSWQQQQKY